MAEDLYNYGDEPIETHHKDNLFLWTVLILLLIGAAFACWLGSFYVFGHPEDPRCYAILKKLGKIEKPRRFDITAAPQGEFLSAQRVFERYSTFTPLELQRENAELLRIYIRNYTETKKVVPYVRGSFTVMEVRDLTSKDFIEEGTVAVMQASDYAQVVIEHLFPASAPNAEATKRFLRVGDEFPINKTFDVCAILRVERLADGRMLVTVVPLHYPTYGRKEAVGQFSTEPPLDLNVAAGLPVTKPDALFDSLKRFAQLRANEPIRDEPTQAISGPEVVRIDNVPTGEKAPETGVIPEPPVTAAQPARPLTGTEPVRPPSGVGDLAMNRPQVPNGPVATPLPPGRLAMPPSAVPPPPPPAALRATPIPVPAVPPGALAAQPTPSTGSTMPPTPALSPSGVPLKPFVQSNRGIAPPSESGGSWRVYSAGTQPRGRAITPTEALNLVDQAGSGERLYLVGTFAVTAKGDNKAVFRPRGEALPPGSAVRIIAEFPNGSVPPDENEVFSRDANRAFEVRSISRADDGQTINVEVREITREQ